ncbi:hypothetical protein [uncultured Idiomarina sp.]|uniref:hypothetical protein n=1 Tax=uncultured Idiomarina sp. TaxID=352961 RepID=UPI0032B2A67D
MSQPNEPVQNYEVQSPAIETLLRTQLPSVAGYGGLVRATNTIIPVFDVSAAAEGSTLPFELQNALAFGSQTAFEAANTNADIATVPGFYRVTGTFTVVSNTGSIQRAAINLIDATPTTKIVQQVFVPASLGVNSFFNTPFDLVIFLNTGEKINVSATSTSTIAGSIRQIATSDGTLVEPSGFPV